jgi:hypothetical protein
MSLDFASGYDASACSPRLSRRWNYQRGVPAMRYLGEEMAQIETELRWQFWKRLSVVGFAGTGETWVGSEGDD